MRASWFRGRAGDVVELRPGSDAIAAWAVDTSTARDATDKADANDSGDATDDGADVGSELDADVMGADTTGADLVSPTGQTR
jgi:hypothetical protein